jgi:hypothetical protein
MVAPSVGPNALGLWPEQSGQERLKPGSIKHREFL